MLQGECRTIQRLNDSSITSDPLISLASPRLSSSKLDSALGSHKDSTSSGTEQGQLNASINYQHFINYPIIPLSFCSKNVTFCNILKKIRVYFKVFTSLFCVSMININFAPCYKSRLSIVT